MTSLLQYSMPMEFPRAAPIDDSLDSESAPASPGHRKKRIPKELTAHGTTPSGKPRLFVCNTCTRAFARLEHLRRHERSHTKEKPFTCSVCQRKFSRRDLLLRHAQKLHAGCAEAVSRLRRKLMRADADADPDDGPTLQFLSQSQSQTHRQNLRQNHQPAAKPRADLINFNLNSFGTSDSDAKDPRDPAFVRMHRAPSVRETGLNRQLWDRRHSARGRGTSFSAQSGGNYATAMPRDIDQPQGADSVEFSTPQLLPASTADESMWLNGLPVISGMAKDELDGLVNAQQHGTASRPGQVPGLAFFDLLDASLIMRSDSVASTLSSFNHVDAAAVPPGFGSFPLSRAASVSKYPQSTSHASSVPPGETDDDAATEFGYSFYDVPEFGSASLFAGKQTARPLSPIKQELEDDLPDLENGHGLSTFDQNDLLFPATITEGVNFDLNFLNDIDHLTQDFDAGAKFLPNGYSFYGDNMSVSSSGQDSVPPSQLMSPSSLNPAALHNPLQFAVAEKAHAETTASVLQPPQPLQTPGFSHTVLFTKRMRFLINKSLSKYPISGIMTPTIPSNEKLEFFLRNFNEKFLSHFPFIHPSKLNEYEMMRVNSHEPSSTESAVVCLPLLVATIGALLANNKNDSENLYEASRRTIHIYLENRKNTVNGANDPQNNQSSNPLWLIQSLTLSVIYGLFSDNENNVYIVIRQLNALNSLVKTSIKSKRSSLFTVSEEAELKIQASEDDSLPSFNDARFKTYINEQSQIRIVLMIYKLTNFLLMMYNVPLTLNVNDLGSLPCPNIYDEYLWNFCTFENFKEYSKSVDGKQGFSFYLEHSKSDKIILKDVLFKLSKSDFDPSLVTRVSNLSKYGFSALVHGIFEIKQYEEMKNMDVLSILDNLTLFIDNSRNNSDVYFFPSHSADCQKLDYILLANYTKICAVIDFKLVKEQSWLRNYEELTKNYYKFLKSMELIDDFQYMRVIDCCILVLKVLLFKTEGNENLESQSDRPTLFQNELSFSTSHQTDNEFLSMMSSSLQHQYNTSSNFEKSLNWKVLDEVDFSKALIHSQMLFHIFIILSIFAIQMAKRNNASAARLPNSDNSDLTQLNQRHILVLQLLAKVEEFLHERYKNTKSELLIANLYLFSSFKNDDIFNGHNPERHGTDVMMNELFGNQNFFAYSLEKSLYTLKMGELILLHLYDTNIRICIFRKLSESLNQVRKFLIDDETRILAV